MAYRLDTHVAGELGEKTEFDRAVHPPRIGALEYLLDGPENDDLIQSFPVHLISERLMKILKIELPEFLVPTRPAHVHPGEIYYDMWGNVPYQQYELIEPRKDLNEIWIDREAFLCVSDRFYAVLSRFARLDHCVAMIM